MLKYIFIVAMGFSSLNAYAAKVKMGFLSLEPYYSMIRGYITFTDSVGKTSVKKNRGIWIKSISSLHLYYSLFVPHGESKSKKTEKAIEIADTFDQIDFQTDSI